MGWLRLALVMVGVLLPQIAHAAVCVAYADDPTGSKETLDSCLASAIDGTEIELDEGDHVANNLVVNHSVTIRPVTGKRARIVYDGTLLPAVEDQLARLTRPYLLPNARLLIIDAPGKVVLIEDVPIEPHEVRGSVFSWALDVRAGTVRVEGVRLAGTPLQVVNKTVGSDRVGGVFARVSGGATLIIGPGTVLGGVLGSWVDGALVYATGAGSVVAVEGDAQISDIESRQGAIYADNGAEIQVNADSFGAAAVFERNTALHGGALFAGSGGVITISDGTFQDNQVPYERGAVDGYGGHVAVDGGSLSISDGTFTGGSASYGGAVAGRDASVSITGGRFHLDRDGDGRFDDGEFNQARRGGIVAVVRDETAASLTATLVTFADGRGTLTDLERESGRNRPAGGGIFADGATVTLTDVAVQDNVVTDDGIGGGLACQDCSLNAIRLVATNNGARIGGGVHLTSSNGVFQNPTVHDNGNRKDTLVGGGLFGLGSDVNVTAGDFQRNMALNGGGLAVIGLNDVMLEGGSYIDNEADRGGAVLTAVDLLTLNGATLRSNQAAEGGGGALVLDGFDLAEETVRVPAPELRVLSATIAGNSADIGGGIRVVGAYSEVDLGGLLGNKATTAGGGIDVTGGSMVLRQVDLLDNVADGQGGALHATGAEISLAGSFLRDNSADVGAALMLLQSSTHELYLNRFCANRAATDGIVTVSVPAGTPSDEAVVIRNNLFDGESASREAGAAVVLSGGVHRVANNNFVRISRFALVTDSGETDFHHNLVMTGATGPMLVRGVDGTVVTSRNLFWRDGGVDVIGANTDGTAWLTADTELVEHPHMRGLLRGAAWPDDTGCALPAHYPRPTSPLLSGWPEGYPARQDADHIGLYGGPVAPALPWENDGDEDGHPVIFDCDESDKELGDRLVQFVDADGDGLGGPLWEGDDCGLVPGNVREGGDCDDADPLIGELCSEMASYYGTTCASGAVGGAPWWLGAGVVLLGCRRRRRRP